MQRLRVAEQIKVIKEAHLRIPVYRAATEPYDPEKPSLFDKTIIQENVEVTAVINVLLGIIEFLSKEYLLKGGVIPKDVWAKLKDVRRLVRESRNVITGR